MPHWQLYYHVVWATKDREPIIGPNEEVVIRRSLNMTFEDLAAIPHAVGMMPDHVHVVVSAPPKIAPAELVKRLKGASAHAVNQANGRSSGMTFGWQGEYGILSFGRSALANVVAYVVNQRAHHAEQQLWSGLERLEESRGP